MACVEDGDGDGDLDVLAAAAVSGSVAVLINDGGALTVERTLPVGPHPMGVVFARLDATCGLEIAASAKYADDISHHPEPVTRGFGVAAGMKRTSPPRSSKAPHCR